MWGQGSIVTPSHPWAPVSLVRWLCDSKLSCPFFFCLCCVFVAACELSLVAVSRGYSVVAVDRLLIVVASLVAEHGL